MRARPSVQASRKLKDAARNPTQPEDSSPPAVESHFKNVHAQQFRQNMSQEALIRAQPAECGRAALKAVNCVFAKPLYRYAIDGKDFPTRKTGYPDMADTRAHVRIAPPLLRLIFLQSHAPAGVEFLQPDRISRCIGYLSHCPRALPENPERDRASLQYASACARHDGASREIIGMAGSGYARIHSVRSGFSPSQNHIEFFNASDS